MNQAFRKINTQMIERFFSIHKPLKPPTCAICQKAVNKFEIAFEALRNEYTFAIECHGDVGEIRVPEKYALDAKYEFQINDAFVPNENYRSDGKQLQYIGEPTYDS